MKVCFAWSGFPQYAARCVGAFVRTTGLETVVLATRPNVPVEGMEACCGCKVIWIGREDDVRSVPELQDVTHVFMTGWHVPAFRILGRLARARGGKAICMVDNGVRRSGARAFGRLGAWREILKSVRFRLKFRGEFDGFVVPGKCGRRLLEGYGVAPGLIAEGMYAADAALFRAGPPLAERSKKIIYVGQFVERKNVKRLVEAFEKVKVKGEGEQRWELHLYGSGPLREELVSLAGAGRGGRNGAVEIHGFVQPEELAKKYRESRIFCLPSLEEHWGLVVHEAALSGCVLALSDAVCAADDLLGAENGVTFDPCDVEDMARKLRQVMDLDGEELEAAERESLALASEAGIPRFVEGVRKWLS